MTVLDYRAGVSEETVRRDLAEPSAQLAATFHVDLGEVFEGPFDLLLGLIAKH